MEKKCEQRILKAIKSKTKSLTLSSSRLKAVPPSLGKLSFLTSLTLQNNNLKTLPRQITTLHSLCYLNAGNNKLEDGSLEQLLACTQLVTLHLYKNNIHTLAPQIFQALMNLHVLNLNNNSVSILPPEVSLLQALEHLSLSHNLLESLPTEIGSLKQLKELHVDNNALCSLPSSIHTCTQLLKLILYKNKLKNLPDSIGKCMRLIVLDVSCNELELFPASLCNLNLQEFYFESNPLLPRIPITAIQEEEVFQLREISARVVVKAVENIDRWLEMLERWNPELGQCLSHVGRCALCESPFIQSWLQCVQFIPIKKVLPSLTSHVDITEGSRGPLLPLEMRLCSYQCFNSEGHSYLGIATAYHN